MGKVPRVVWSALAVAAAVTAVATGLAWLLGQITYDTTSPDKDRAAAVNATRQTYLAVLAGSVASIGVFFTGRVYFLNRRAQYTDRYTKAIGQLASEKVTERLGGVYALEHLMRESPRDHETVVDVLAAFVREQAAIKYEDEDAIDVAIPEARQVTPPTDVQAALTVIGRRPIRQERNQLDLSRTDLAFANLSGARLDGANLRNCVLRSTNFEGASLRRVRFSFSDLTGASFADADLTDAWYLKAGLDGATFDGRPVKKPARGVDLRRLSYAASLKDRLLPDSFRAEASALQAARASQTKQPIVVEEDSDDDDASEMPSK